MNKTAQLTDDGDQNAGSQTYHTTVAHGLSPMLIGLVASVIAMAFIAPATIRNGHLVTTALLIPMLILCVGIYAWSVLQPGPIMGLQVDTSNRILELIHVNAFAEKRRPVPFAIISGLSRETTYDRDGYAASRTVLALKDGETIELALQLDDGHLRELQRVVGSNT